MAERHGEAMLRMDLRMDARGPLTFSRQRSKVLGLRYGPGAIVPAHLLQFRQRTSAPRVFEMGWREFMRGRRGMDNADEQ